VAGMGEVIPLFAAARTTATPSDARSDAGAAGADVGVEAPIVAIGVARGVGRTAGLAGSGGGPARQPYLRKRRAVSWFADGCRAEGSGDLAAARAAYDRALATDPQHPGAHTNLARLLHLAGALADAEAHYRLALLADRSIAAHWFNLGVALHDQRRNAECVAAYRQALAIDPQLADAHYNLAMVLDRTGDEGSQREAVRHLAAYRALVSRRIG
jgi:tetratricopeptide (TPR) repeat protein